MGTVYRAHDQLLNRPVAVKVLSAHMLDKNGQARLLNEAQATAKLNHPNIVTIHDAGMDVVRDKAAQDSTPFIVMELVPGQSLRHLPPPALPELLSIGRQICAALSHAHAQSIIHRDLKPENILITDQHVVKLVDFGLARSITDPRLTEAGTLVGTLFYMAPELYSGGEANVSSDLYALGVILYELAAGHSPFTGETIAGLITQHLTGIAPPPSLANPHLPEGFDTLIARLLSKRPEERPASATEVRRGLEQLAAAENIVLPATGKPEAPGGKLPRQTVLLVDDDPFNREGVRLYLRQNGLEVMEAGDEASAWDLAQTQPPDAVVMDISIPPDAHTPVRSGSTLGIRLTARLKQARPALGVVLFSAHDDHGGEVLDMVREGARGLAYKLKGTAPSALLSAIHEVMGGRIVIDPEVRTRRPGLADELLKRLLPDERPWVELAVNSFDTLTLRERELAQRLAASHNTEGIAKTLSVTPKTAENYIGHVYDKLGLNEMGRAAPHLRKVLILAKACLVRDLREGPTA
jgi:DNA-binding NarL/FixJ family response regulator